MANKCLKRCLGTHKVERTNSYKLPLIITPALWTGMLTLTHGKQTNMCNFFKKVFSILSHHRNVN